VDVGTSKSRGGGLGLQNKPYRLRCIRGICSRGYAPGPDDEEEEEEEVNVVEMYISNAGILTKSQHLMFMVPCILIVF
jgi:hypothetical protein